MELQFKDIKKGQEYLVADTLIIHSPITKTRYELEPETNVFIKDLIYENDEIRVRIEYWNGWTTWLIGEPEDYTGLKTID